MKRLHKVHIPILDDRSLKNMAQSSQIVFCFFIKIIYINRKKYIKVDKCISIPKWRVKGYIFSQTDWKKIFELPFKSIKSKLQWLQFQILHRIIPTNDYL